eukprot:409470-Hanusia_phi.AAC.1
MPAMQAGIAADNLVVAVYFIAIFAMANSAGSPSGKNLEEKDVEEEGSGSFTIVDVSSGEEAVFCYQGKGAETLSKSHGSVGRNLPACRSYRADVLLG